MNFDENEKLEIFLKNKQFTIVRYFASLVNASIGSIILGALYIGVRKSGFIWPIVIASFAMATGFFLFASLGSEQVIRKLAYDRKIKNFYFLLGSTVMITVAVCAPLVAKQMHH